jgi:hypothetical protein
MKRVEPPGKENRSVLRTNPLQKAKIDAMYHGANVLTQSKKSNLPVNGSVLDKYASSCRKSITLKEGALKSGNKCSSVASANKENDQSSLNKSAASHQSSRSREIMDSYRKSRVTHNLSRQDIFKLTRATPKDATELLNASVSMKKQPRGIAVSIDQSRANDVSQNQSLNMQCPKTSSQTGSMLHEQIKRRLSMIKDFDNSQKPKRELSSTNGSQYASKSVDGTTSHLKPSTAVCEAIARAKKLQAAKKSSNNSTSTSTNILKRVHREEVIERENQTPAMQPTQKEKLPFRQFGQNIIPMLKITHTISSLPMNSGRESSGIVSSDRRGYGLNKWPQSRLESGQASGKAYNSFYEGHLVSPCDGSKLFMTEDDSKMNNQLTGSHDHAEAKPQKIEEKQIITSGYVYQASKTKENIETYQESMKTIREAEEKEEGLGYTSQKESHASNVNQASFQNLIDKYCTYNREPFSILSSNRATPDKMKTLIARVLDDDQNKQFSSKRYTSGTIRRVENNIESVQEENEINDAVEIIQNSSENRVKWIAREVPTDSLLKRASKEVKDFQYQLSSEPNAQATRNLHAKSFTFGQIGSVTSSVEDPYAILAAAQLCQHVSPATTALPASKQSRLPLQREDNTIAQTDTPANRPPSQQPLESMEGSFITRIPDKKESTVISQYSQSSVSLSTQGIDCDIERLLKVIDHDCAKVSASVQSKHSLLSPFRKLDGITDPVELKRIIRELELENKERETELVNMNMQVQDLSRLARVLVKKLKGSSPTLLPSN